MRVRAGFVDRYEATTGEAVRAEVAARLTVTNLLDNAVRPQRVDQPGVLQSAGRRSASRASRPRSRGPAIS